MIQEHAIREKYKIKSVRKDKFMKVELKQKAIIELNDDDIALLKLVCNFANRYIWNLNKGKYSSDYLKSINEVGMFMSILKEELHLQ